MSDSNISKIKTRIMALLAKAKGTDNEHEAAAFLGKAMDMMQQYQLDVADMVDADDPILRHVGMTAASSGHAWRWRLYSAVARLYGCKSCHVERAVPGKGGRLVPGLAPRVARAPDIGECRADGLDAGQDEEAEQRPDEDADARHRAHPAECSGARR